MLDESGQVALATDMQAKTFIVSKQYCFTDANSEIRDQTLAIIGIITENIFHRQFQWQEAEPCAVEFRRTVRMLQK